LTTTRDRLRAAVDYYVETIDEFDEAPGQVGLVRAWAEAGEEPGVRDMLVRRRERLVGAAQLLIREGMVRGELPDGLDVEPLARPGALGLLAVDAGRAGDPRGACRLQGGRRIGAGRPDTSRRRARSRVAHRHRAGLRAARRHGHWLVSRRLLPGGGADRPTLGR